MVALVVSVNDTCMSANEFDKYDWTNVNTAYIDDDDDDDDDDR